MALTPDICCCRREFASEGTPAPTESLTMRLARRRAPREEPLREMCINSRPKFATHRRVDIYHPWPDWCLPPNEKGEAGWGVLLLTGTKDDLVIRDVFGR